MALSLAGLPTDRFFFAGFLPAQSSARRKALNSLAAVPGTLVGTLSDPSGTATSFVLTNAPAGGSAADNAKFQITNGTNVQLQLRSMNGVFDTALGGLLVDFLRAGRGIQWPDPVPPGQAVICGMPHRARDRQFDHLLSHLGCNHLGR